jgi:hypothetical protein
MAVEALMAKGSTADSTEDGCLSAPGSAEDIVLSTTNSQCLLSTPALPSSTEKGHVGGTYKKVLTLPTPSSSKRNGCLKNESSLSPSATRSKGRLSGSSPEEGRQITTAA